ncbi:unnamed protein product [Rotaria socialis]
MLLSFPFIDNINTDLTILMAQRLCCYLIFFILFINHINMIASSNQDNYFNRHIGLAYKRMPNNPSNNQHQQQTFVSPEFLISRWMELFSEQSKNNET